MNKAPTLLGHVGDVTGSAVRVRQVESVSSGLAIIDGRTYRIGQVGTFVRIPQGYLDLFGVVSEVGANAVPEALRAVDNHGERWLSVQLIGESIGVAFERGISQYPATNDEVHIVTESDLRRIYGVEGNEQVVIGRLASSESIEVRLDLTKLITRHSAVLGSTGSGKSTTVASLLRALSTSVDDAGKLKYPSARIILLDIHGEYAKALGDVAKVFRINPHKGEEELAIPYWALDFEELLDFLSGGIADEKAIHFRDKALELKKELLKKWPRPGADSTSLTIDSPVPFSLNKLWYDLMDEQVKTFEGPNSPNRDKPALVAAGDPATLTAPTYKPWAMDRSVVLNQQAPGIRRQLDHLRSRLLDHQYDFLLHPGEWEPDLSGKPKKDLDQLLAGWLGHDRPITILDLSGVPSPVTIRLVGALLRVIYDALFWSRDKSEGGVNRPLLIVMEEAHAYLAKETNGPAGRLARRIVKEGRKYGIGALIVSQRPAEVDETILSQCGTFVALRLSNSADRNQVKGTMPDSLGGLLDMLPVLRTGEAIVTGEAARLPMRVRISLPGEGRRPQSEDPEVALRWAAPRIREDYEQMVAAWRAQSPRTVKTKRKIKRVAVTDSAD